MVPVSTFLHLNIVSSSSQHRGATCIRGQKASRFTAAPSAEYVGSYCAKNTNRPTCVLSRRADVSYLALAPLGQSAGFCASFDGILKAIGKAAGYLSNTACCKKLKAVQPFLATDDWLYFFAIGCTYTCISSKALTFVPP